MTSTDEARAVLTILTTFGPTVTREGGVERREDGATVVRTSADVMAEVVRLVREGEG